MFEIVKSVISAGGYKLTEIQHKIKKLFLLGDLTEEQADKLLTMASGGISADAERPETLKLIQSLAAEMEALKARVAALEGTEEEMPSYPAWKP